MNKISLSLFYSALLLNLLVACNSNNPGREVTEEPEAVVDTGSTDAPEFSGRLYTSGLSPAEAEKLQLPLPAYQLRGQENYFISGHDSLSRYIGQCISLTGVEEVWPPATEIVNEQFTYHRGKLNYTGVRLLDGDICSALQDSGEKQVVHNSETKVYKGTIGRMERPAPDIAYDYVLRLEKPFRDEQHPVQPGKLIKELPLFVEQQDIKHLEQAISSGESVELKAALVQGYAESKVLQLDEVQRPGTGAR